MTQSSAVVVAEWFAAHSRGDLTAARALLANDATIRTSGPTLIGFDAFMEWYDARREGEGPEFGYEVVGLLGGTNHAAAIIALRGSDGRTWRQVAIYEVTKGLITAIVLYEDDELHPTSSPH